MAAQRMRRYRRRAKKWMRIGLATAAPPTASAGFIKNVESQPNTSANPSYCSGTMSTLRKRFDPVSPGGEIPADRDVQRIHRGNFNEVHLCPGTSCSHSRFKGIQRRQVTGTE